MAKSHTYVYDIHTDIKREDFESILKNSREIFIKDGKGGITYIYDDGSAIFYPLRFTEDLEDLGMLRHLSIDEIYALVIKGCRILSFLDRKLECGGVYLKSIEKSIDYTQTISDLERLGCVKTMPTTNYLANDERKFSFVDDPLVEYEVDCLGTSLCQELSDRVVDAWKQYQGE